AGTGRALRLHPDHARPRAGAPAMAGGGRHPAPLPRRGPAAARPGARPHAPHRAALTSHQRSTACYSPLMSRVIPQRELRNQTAAVIAAVARGESFVVTRNGAPVAEIRPVAQARRTFVPRAAVAAALRGGPHLDSASFRADLAGLADQSLWPADRA